MKGGIIKKSNNIGDKYFDDGLLNVFHVVTFQSAMSFEPWD